MLIINEKFLRNARKSSYDEVFGQPNSALGNRAKDIHRRLRYFHVLGLFSGTIVFWSKHKANYCSSPGSDAYLAVWERDARQSPLGAWNPSESVGR